MKPLLLFDNDLLNVPVEPGIYPCIAPVCDDCGHRDAQNKVTYASVNRVAKQDLPIKDRYTPTWDVTSKNEMEIEGVAVSWSAAGWDTIHANPINTTNRFTTKSHAIVGVNRRFYKPKPLVRAWIAGLGTNSAKIKILLSDGSYVYHTAKARYTVGKCRDVAWSSSLQSIAYDESDAFARRMADIPGLRQVLEDMVPTGRVQEAMQDAWSFRSMLCPNYWGDNYFVDYERLCEIGLLDELPKCPSSKPFAAGASFKIKATPLAVVLKSELEAGVAEIGKFAAYTDGATQQELLAEVNKAMSDKEHTFFYDSAGNCMIALVVMDVRAVNKETVLARYDKQDEQLNNK